MNSDRTPGAFALTAMLLVALAGVSCTVDNGRTGGGPPARSRTDSPPGTTPAEPARVFVLLADTRVLGLGGARFNPVWSTDLGTGSGRQVIGHYLAWGRAGELVALLRGSESSDRLIALDPTTGRQRAEWELPGGVAYRSLAVGTRTGVVYLFGNRPSGRATLGTGQDAVVTVLDAQSGRVIRSWTARSADGRDWSVYRGEVSADEQRVFLSYHGSDTTGVDWFTLRGQTLTRCRPPAPDLACIDSHGDFTPYGSGLLVATGLSAIKQVGLRGRVIRRYDTDLRGNHLMGFALDRERKRLYAVGSCGYVGGLSMVQLSTGATRRLAPRLPKTRDSEAALPANGVCGERISRLGQGRVVITKVANSVPEPDSAGSVLVVDTDGKVVASHPTTAPLDVLTKP